MKTIDSLGVFWSFVDDSTGEIYQEEVDGLIFYGYWPEMEMHNAVNDLSSFEGF